MSRLWIFHVSLTLIGIIFYLFIVVIFLFFYYIIKIVKKVFKSEITIVFQSVFFARKYIYFLIKHKKNQKIIKIKLI
jgi:hypothetical protein